MDFLKPAKYFFIISIVLILVSIGLLVVPGPILSIEFTGGTRMELVVPGKTTDDVKNALLSFEQVALSPTVNKVQSGNFLARTKGLTDEEHNALDAHLKQALGDVSIVQYTTIGPTVGKTLQIRAIQALIAASIGIVLYLAFAFRKIPRKYSPWKFGAVAVVTLLHDVMITVGIFVILSHYTSFEVDTLFVTALLTILGYSVNDTIIVFDRIRETIQRGTGGSFRVLPSDAPPVPLTLEDLRAGRDRPLEEAQALLAAMTTPTLAR